MITVLNVIIDESGKVDLQGPVNQDNLVTVIAGFSELLHYLTLAQKQVELTAKAANVSGSVEEPQAVTKIETEAEQIG